MQKLIGFYVIADMSMFICMRYVSKQFSQMISFHFPNKLATIYIHSPDEGTEMWKE